MDRETFSKQIERLRKAYSASSLTEERVKVLWDKFQPIENRNFEKAITFIIGECTGQTIPALSKFTEAIGMFRSKGAPTVSMQEVHPAHFCDACRDFGYGFVGDMVVSCICEAGIKIGPEELVLAQVQYDRGAKFMKKGAILIPEIAQLPYDPRERIGESDVAEEEI